MKSLWRATILCPAIVLAVAAAVWGQASRDPHIAYVYPAGGCLDSEVTVTVGGQYLNGAAEVHFSGEGVRASVLKHTKIFTQREGNQLRRKLDKARAELENPDKDGNPTNGRAKNTDVEQKAIQLKLITEEELDAYYLWRKQRNDPKRQLNPQLGELVTLKVEFDRNASPGKRDLRLKTGAGLSNPLCFYVGQLPEHCEAGPDAPADAKPYVLPVVLNGQVLPGEVDRFRFRAQRGDRLVVAAAARELIPYLADAVPGWFQATLTLYDPDGFEVAYADDHRFHPDPVLYFNIPKSGIYHLEINDAIYRGREDFVYRIALGEIPFVTSIFPLGCQSGDKVTVELKGWNLPVNSLALDATGQWPGSYPISIRGAKCRSNRVPFVVDTLPECLEEEPNNDIQNAQPLRPPVIVNGRIGQPGDWDVFRFDGRAAGKVIVEVLARRLNSPVDSLLKLTDADGRQLMINDDHEDKGSGLATHHADSLLEVELPDAGAYYIHLGDTQNKGGVAYAYRLRISARRPDFELRVVPATINARPGTTMPITVYAMRRDGFSDAIALDLKDLPPGFKLSGGPLPADKNEVELKLSVPKKPRPEPFKLGLEGVATVNGRELRRPAVPADDMMQAFIYHHLVTAEDWMVSVSGRGKKKGK